MEDSNFKSRIRTKKDISAESLAGVDSCRLGAFFDLLFKIDKRNYPELYEHNKSGTSPDQTTKGSDGICLRGD
jgi:hypothetical protein